MRIIRYLRFRIALAIGGILLAFDGLQEMRETITEEGNQP